MAPTPGQSQVLGHLHQLAQAVVDIHIVPERVVQNNHNNNNKLPFGTLGGLRLALICAKGKDSGVARCWTLLAPFSSYMPHM